MFGWEFAPDFPHRFVEILRFPWHKLDLMLCSLHFVQGLGRRHGRCLSTAPAFVPWDARCGGDGVLELWGAGQKKMEQKEDIFSNLCTWKLLDGGGKEKACDSQMFVFLFLPLGRVCLSTSLNHSRRLQSAIVPRHSASCAASVGRSDFDIFIHWFRATAWKPQYI